MRYKKEYKISLVLLITLLLCLSVSAFSLQETWNKITGKAFDSNYDSSKKAPTTLGPSQDSITCMASCMNCVSIGVNCTGNQAECMGKCNLEPEPQDEDQKCMQSCITQDCDKYDFACQNKYKDKCEKQCNMIKQPEAKSEEEQCIRDCIAKVDSSIMCQAAQGGEQGNEVCKRCAEECVHLYAGPCLNEEKLEAKKSACNTCERCYGEPIMGDSGEGYECIVDVECKDASTEFGDEPGTGPGIILSKVGDTVGNVIDAIGGFFKGLFGSDKESLTEENPSTSLDELPESNQETNTEQ